ncbi:MAG: NifB/NifX family molybdenum-iron cluster-binding protein [Pseudomonadota bacterium]
MLSTTQATIQEYAEKTSDLLVAFASSDGEIVNQHFGSSRGFSVYSINAEKHELVFQTEFKAEKKDGNEEKLKAKLSYLIGCDIVFCASVGASATRQLIALGATPKQVKEGPDIEDLLDDLTAQLNGEPEFWLANILRQKQKVNQSTSRFAELDEEESWD